MAQLGLLSGVQCTYITQPNLPTTSTNYRIGGKVGRAFFVDLSYFCCSIFWFENLNMCKFCLFENCNVCIFGMDF